jgi:hypothetical protein
MLMRSEFSLLEILDSIIERSLSFKWADRIGGRNTSYVDLPSRFSQLHLN